jgi:cytochrome P450
MSATNEAGLLDRDRMRELFDLRSNRNKQSGGDYTEDPHPAWHRLRETGPIHEGTVHALTGYPGEAMFHGLPEPDRPHFSAFSYAACNDAYRDEETFASSPDAVDAEGEVGVQSSMLSMGGAQHRRYRGLVQPSFVPAKARWWIDNWIEDTVHGLIDHFIDEGRAELNVDFCAAIPVLTITNSFGFSVDQALDVREKLTNPPDLIGMLAPIVAARREQPQDDLISVLVEAEYTDDDGVVHRLSDIEIYTFAILLLFAGSGTTWKQMGITIGALLQRPELLDRLRDDRNLVKQAIEESVRWLPTDPMFSRWVTRDVDFHGTHIPKGSMLHLCLGSANHDPERWERPDEFDIDRAPKPTLAFGGGPHICLGMHVARAEMNTAINALLDRLPNLRLDPDAEPPRFIGFYERGATELPVVFG